ncbi:MAG: hypothetical protein AMXMBFR53_42910 [Gemmatimonadota bacterium]
MTRASPAPACLAALALLAVPLGAQEAPDRWSIQAELGFNGSGGNSSYSVLRTGLKAKHLRTDVAEFEASFLVRYGKNDEKVIADDARASVKLDLWPQQRFSPFFFADLGRDKIRKLDGRFSGGAGGKWAVWTDASGTASVSVAGLYDYQNFLVATGSAGLESESLARWSFRTKVERKLGAASLEQVALFQPVWDDGSDFVLDVTHSLSTQVLGNLSLTVEHQYLRDSTPPPGVGKDDQRFAVLLKLTF